MDKKQSLAFLLSAMMVATPFSAFAAEDGTAPADADASAKAATEQSVENNQAKGKASVQEDAQLDENELPIVPGEGTGEEKKDETPASNAWEATDFTYGEWTIDSNAMLCPSNDTEAYLKTGNRPVGFRQSEAGEQQESGDSGKGSDRKEGSGRW